MKGKTLFVNILAHNERGIISPAIQSILRQRTSNGERVVVNVFANGCTDGTEAVVKALSDRDDRVRLFVIPTKGKVNALRASVEHYRELERGTQETCGDRLVYVDADVRLPSRDTLQRLCSALDADPALYLVSAYPSPCSLYDGKRDLVSWMYRARAAAQYAARPNMVRGPCYVIRWDVLRRVTFPESLLSDDMYLECCLGGHFLMDYENPVIVKIKPTLKAEVRRDLFHMIAREQVYRWRRQRSISALDRETRRMEWTLTNQVPATYVMHLVRRGKLGYALLLSLWYLLQRRNEARGHRVFLAAQESGLDLHTYWQTQR